MRWEGVSVGDLFDRIRKAMPPDARGRLAAQEYADVVSFVLQVQKFPAGQKELATTYAPLS